MTTYDDLNDLQSQADNLLHLLQTAHNEIQGLDFGPVNGRGINHPLDRVSALVAVARDYTEGVCKKIDAHFDEIAGAGPKGGVS